MSEDEVALATSLLESIELQEVAFIRLTADLKQPPPAGAQLSFKTSGQISWFYSTTSAYTVVELHVALAWRGDEEGAAEPTAFADLGVATMVEYALNEYPLPIESLRAYLAVHGPMHSWPYFRAEIQSMTTKLALPPLTLPTLVSGQVSKTFKMPLEPVLKEPLQG